MEETSGNPSEMDLFVFLRDVMEQAKRKLVPGLVLILLCSLGVTGYLGIRHRTVYEATASFTVRVQDNYNPAAAAQLEKTIPAIVTGALLRERVTEGLENVQNLIITARTDANIITVTVADSQSQRAQNVLDRVLTCFPEIAGAVVGPVGVILLEETAASAEPFRFLDGLIPGAAVGAAAWLLLAGFLALTWNPVHTEGELVDLLNCDHVISLPDEKDSSFPEALRRVRMRLEKEMTGEKKILLVSGATWGEGTTAVARNLAGSLVESGKRVLLIDCDLRTPSAAQGLCQYLSGNASLRELIQKTDEKNLYKIPGGNGNACLADRLGQKEMETLLQSCREQFDWVILDTPPCASLADASEIGGLADGALMVVRPRWASRAQILDGVRRLNDSGLMPVGCVMNRRK